MKRRSFLPLLLAFFVLGVTGVWSQTLEYPFNATNETYTPIDGGLLLGTETSDDQRFLDPAVPAGGTTTTGPGLDIGFNFTFNGAVFDRLAINNNGWISLGQSALTPSVNNSSTSGYTPISSVVAITPPVLYNRISALGRDLQAQAGASLRLETIGAAPNRICVIQWANYKKYGTTGTGDSFNFQIRLYETSNNIKIVYGAFVCNTTAGNMQVGLRGPDVTDFNSREGSTGWENTNPATANTQYVILSDVYFPANGLTYNFNFPMPTAEPNPATAVFPLNGALLVPPTVLLQWQSGGGLPTGYKLSLGTNNPPTNMLNNQDLGALTSYNPDPDLSLNTTYYWKVVPYNGFGDALNCPVWSFSTHGDPQIDVLPYSQTWDLVTAPVLPFDWTNIIQSTSTSAVVETYASTTYAHSLPNCARLYNPSDASAVLILVGPPLSATYNVNTIRVKFWARSSGAGYPLSVGVISNPQDPATYTEVHNVALTTTLTEYTLSMTGYAGTGTHISFKHGLGATGRTLYVDDILFEQIGANDLACSSVSGNTTPSAGTATTFNASIYNWGTAAQSNYTVKLFDSSNTELASIAGVTVAPGSTVEVPLVWTPSAEGNVVIYGKVFLDGDINPANDQSPNLNVTVMGPGALVVSIGDGTAVNTTTGVPTPYGTYFKNFRQQYLFTAAEILAAGGAPGLITALSFDVQNVNTCSPMPNYTIKLKHTQQSVLTTTFELGDYTQVWYQNDFLPVTGWNTHGLTAPFVWDGTSNLLVDIMTSLIPGAYTQNASVYYTPTTGVNTCLRYQSDSVEASTATTGTLAVNRANIRITLNVADMATLNGTVSSGGNPVDNANVVIIGTTHSTQTNVLGQYNFPFVQPGTYNVTASKVGYESQTLPVTLIGNQTSTLNFNLTSSSSVNVTGFVVGSDQPTVGLVEAEVTLVGLITYNALTNATGHFTIPGVLSGNSYNYTISKEGYQDATGTINVGTSNFDMGTVVLSEITYPPTHVVATENVAQTQVTIVWNAPTPEPPLDDFEQSDCGWVPSSNWTNPLGDWEWTNTYDIANWAPTYTGTSVIPPPTAHSGTGMWGTKINTNYNNSGGYNYLTKTFNLAGSNNTQMRFWSWENVFGNFDYCQVTVNGTLVWGPSWLYTNTVWMERVIDLSAYDGMSDVVIQFQMFATTVVNYAGWYIDDVYVGPAQTRTVTSAPSITPAFYAGLSETEAAAVVNQRTPRTTHDPVPQPTTHRIIGYRVWCLLSSNQGNEAQWILITPSTITDTTFTYTNWAPLPSGVYKFAVKAIYLNDVQSVPAFSNEIHKGMMGVLSGSVTEFGTNVPISGATITAGDYTGNSNATGAYSFLVYQGTYNVICAKPGYQTANQTGVVIVGTQTTTQNFVLTEVTLPPGTVTATEISPNVEVTWTAPATASSNLQSDIGSYVYTNGNSGSITRSEHPESYLTASRISQTDLASDETRNDRTLLGCQVWRLLQGQENSEPSWITLTPNPIAGTSYLDTGWGALPDGTYKWAVKAIYTGGAASVATFSNAIAKITQIGTIAGIVRTTTNAPISGATVTCGTTTATTNAGGAYSMQVIAGVHDVTANHPNYSSVTHTGVSVVVGQTTTVNFQLPPSGIIISDGFESYENFAILFAPWTLVDVDQSTTYGMTGITWPNAYAAQAYMIFVPSATTPAVTDANPHTGIKQAACFASTTPPNNDWLITPQFTGAAQIKFWARSYTATYGLERFKVGVSTTGTAPANFTIISGTNYIQAPVEWTEYTYNLWSYNPTPIRVGIQCLSDDAFIFFVDDVLVLSPAVSNDDPNAPVMATVLNDNYPNPFNPETTISFSVKEASPVTIEIFNVKGQLVKTLVNDMKDAGNHTVVWRGLDNNNRPVASGVYYYKMNAGKYSSTRKMILMK